MNKYIISLIFLFSLGLQVRPQCISDDSKSPPCNGIISTDPDPRYTRNQERSSMKNTFDWRKTTWQTYKSTKSFLNYSIE